MGGVSIFLIFNCFVLSVQFLANGIFYLILFSKII